MSDDEGFGGLFQEEEVEEERIEDKFENLEIGTHKIKLRIVGSHCLWGNYLWNASRCIAQRIVESPKMVKGKTVIELGAAGGLPSIVSVKEGAKYVVMTDYSDKDLIENMQTNVDTNLKEETNGKKRRVDVFGYIWNTNTKGLLEKCLCKSFDVIIMSDLVFNHAQHRDLVESCILLGRPGKTSIYIVYSHHLPQYLKRDMAFFAMLEEYKFNCKKLKEYKYDVMFPKDSGDVEIRKTVHFYQATFQEDSVKYYHQKLKLEKMKLEKQAVNDSALMEKERIQKEKDKGST